MNVGVKPSRYDVPRASPSFLRTLPPRLAQYQQLRWQGLTQQAIAEAMEIRPITVAHFAMRTHAKWVAWIQKEEVV